MCGIVGFINTSNVFYKEADYQRLLKIMERMLLIDVVRGKDSTGLACVKSDGEVLAHKKAMGAFDFLDLNSTNALLKIAKYKAIIGHNRSATAGKVVTSNSHPFQHGDITLVHNGTLRNFGGDFSIFPTDSEGICYAMSKNGVKDTLEKLTGSYALVWHDKSDNSINFARNSERPMSFLRLDENILLFASEEWIMSGGISPSPVDYSIIPEGEFETLPVGKWVKYFMDGSKAKVTDFKLVKALPPAYTSYHYSKEGRDALDDLGVKYGDTILFKVYRIERGGAAGNFATMEGVPVSNNPTFNAGKIKVRMSSVKYEEAVAAQDMGISVWAGVVSNASVTHQNTILVYKGRPVCGSKRIKRRRLPKRLDGLDKEPIKKNSTWYDKRGKVISLAEFKDINKEPCPFCNQDFDHEEDDVEYYGEPLSLVHLECLLDDYERNLL